MGGLLPARVAGHFISDQKLSSMFHIKKAQSILTNSLHSMEVTLLIFCVHVISQHHSSVMFSKLNNCIGVDGQWK